MDDVPELPFDVPEDLYPFEHRFITVNGIPVHYVDEGEGPILLLLHGNPTWSFMYRRVILELRDSFRCIAPDLPGFGMSGKPRDYGYTPREHRRVLEFFMNELDLRGATMVVHDWGGPIGLGVAVREPARFDRFVIQNTWAWPVNGDPHFERFSKLVGGSIGGFLIRRFNVFVNVILPLGIATRRLDSRERAAYRAPFAKPRDRTPTHVFPREILGSFEFLSDVDSGLVRLKDKPALILWGTSDFAFRQREREELERRFPVHKTVLLEGASHYVAEDAPDAIAGEIRAWMTAD